MPSPRSSERIGGCIAQRTDLRLGLLLRLGQSSSRGSDVVLHRVLPGDQTGEYPLLRDSGYIGAVVRQGALFALHVTSIKRHPAAVRCLDLGRHDDMRVYLRVVLPRGGLPECGHDRAVRVGMLTLAVDMNTGGRAAPSEVPQHGVHSPVVRVEQVGSPVRPHQTESDFDAEKVASNPAPEGMILSFASTRSTSEVPSCIPVTGSCPDRSASRPSVETDPVSPRPCACQPSRWPLFSGPSSARGFLSGSTARPAGRPFRRPLTV